MGGGASNSQKPHIIFQGKNGDLFAFGVRDKEAAYAFFLGYDSKKNQPKPLAFISRRSSEKDALNFYKRGVDVISAADMIKSAKADEPPQNEVSEERDELLQDEEWEELTELFCIAPSCLGIGSYR